MSRNEKKGHGGKHSRPKKWSGARRPAGPATTALGTMSGLVLIVLSSFVIILMGKKELVALLLLSFSCLVTVSVL